jgi:hypothetical protein
VFEVSLMFGRNVANEFCVAERLRALGQIPQALAECGSQSLFISNRLVDRIREAASKGIV